MIDPMIYVGLSDPPLLNNSTLEEKLENIINKCCEHLNLSKKDVLYKIITKAVKDRPISDCRKLISYYIRKENISSKLLEKEYPESRGLDHASILNNAKTVKGFLEVKDPQFIKYIEQIKIK